MMMGIDAVFFDLDGTLADTAPDLAAAANRLVIEHGHAPVAYEKLRPVASHARAGCSVQPSAHSPATLTSRRCAISSSTTTRPTSPSIHACSTACPKYWLHSNRPASAGASSPTRSPGSRYRWLRRSGWHRGHRPWSVATRPRMPTSSRPAASRSRTQWRGAGALRVCWRRLARHPGRQGSRHAHRYRGLWLLRRRRAAGNLGRDFLVRHPAELIPLLLPA